MFGKYAKMKRELRELSQHRVAKYLGYENRCTVCRLEKNQIEWSLSDIVRLARLFGMKVSELFIEFENWKDKQ